MLEDVRQTDKMTINRQTIQDANLTDKKINTSTAMKK